MQTHIHIHIHTHTHTYTYIHACMHTYIQTDRQTYRHPDMQTYRHTGIQRYRHTEIQTYRHTDIQTYRHTAIQTYIHTYLPTYIHTYIHTYQSQLQIAVELLHWGVVFEQELSHAHAKLEALHGRLGHLEARTGCTIWIALALLSITWSFLAPKMCVQHMIKLCAWSCSNCPQLLADTSQVKGVEPACLRKLRRLLSLSAFAKHLGVWSNSCEIRDSWFAYFCLLHSDTFW